MSNAATFHRQVIFCGAFPPPVNGLAMVNRSVLDLLVGLGMNVITIDIAARGGMPGTLLRRLAALGHTAWLLLRPGPARVLYYALSSGLGQYFDLLAIVLARVSGVRTVIHHHNFSYLRVPTLSSRLIFAVATRGHAIHICLCDSMAGLLQQTYGECHEVAIVSNAAFIPADDQIGLRALVADCHVRVGYLSALTPEKGLHDFLDLAEACAGQGIRFLVAGNAPEDAVRARLEALAAHGVVDFRGAVHGNDKCDYLRALDIFVFPSRYRHEAQPLVVFEALAAGAVVVSHAIACMCDLDGMPGISLVEEGQLAAGLGQALPPDTHARLAQAQDIASRYRALHLAQRDGLKNTFLALLA